MALVITIIVLLILAGITISLTIGQRGILNRAQEAGRNYREVAKGEENELSKFTQEVDNIILEIDTPNLPSEPKYTEVEGVPVPKGFTHIEGTKDTGFVIKDISVDKEGNPTQTNGNEFVWVPCTENGENGSIQYERYAFSREGWKYTQTQNEETGEINVPTFGEYVFTEIMPSIEINSIKKYGGFYIGRYEVGIEGGTQDLSGYDKNNYIAPNVKWTGWKNGKAVVQKDKQVWNYITRDKVIEIAEGMYVNNSAVISRLCSSYAWDTTLQFIGGEYAVNSEGDNYSGKLKNTGIETTPRNNIYDMGGNVIEWTIEVCSDQDNPCTLRGGNYGFTASDLPAGSRYYGSQNVAFDYFGFRSTLYIGL